MSSNSRNHNKLRKALINNCQKFKNFSSNQIKSNKFIVKFRWAVVDDVSVNVGGTV